MSIREHVALLEELATLDSEIRQLDDQITQQRDALSEQRTELAQLKERIEAASVKIAEMNKSRGELTLEARSTATQVERSREKLARARNEREQNAATRELEELRRIQKEREEEVGKLTMLEAAAKKSKDDDEAGHAKISGQLEQSEGSTEADLRRCESARAEKAESRKKLTTKLPKNILNRYETIRKRRGTAIANTIGEDGKTGACQACHVALPPQQFQKILRDESLELCPMCNRILYFKKPEPPPES